MLYVPVTKGFAGVLGVGFKEIHCNARVLSHFVDRQNRYVTVRDEFSAEKNILQGCFVILQPDKIIL
ncbi:MAG: hypothetical protein GY765_30390 [bacterium]|nr:hypothetical protein [bacterium]